MPITVRVSNGIIEYFTSTSSTSQTVNLSDAAIGDLRVLVCNFSPDGTGTVPSHPSITGWTQIGISAPTGAASDSRLSIYYRLVESGDTLTSATLGITLSNTATVGSVCYTLEGINSIDILDVTVPSFITGTGNRDCPSITTSTDNAFVCHACIQDATNGAITDSDIPSGDTLLGTMANNPPSNGMNLGVSYNIQATAGASGIATWQQSSSEEWVGATFAIRELSEGIISITPDEFRMHQANLQITITGAGFGGTQGTGTVYISIADTIAGNNYLVDIGRAITSWSATEIIVNLVFLVEAEIIGLQRLGPGADRYTIVLTDTASEYSSLVTIHRPPAFTMVPSPNFIPGTTTAQLTSPGIKTTGDMDGGRLEETANPSATGIDLTLDGYREDEYCFAPTIYARKVAYEFRIVYSGQGPNVISQVPYLSYTGESGIKIRSINFALSTTVGTQDITIPDLGASATIKGVLFFACGATALDAVQADSRMSVGGAANTTRFITSRATGDNLNPVLTSRASDLNDECIRINNNTGGSLSLARVNSWIDNGIRLDIDVTDGNAYRCFAVFFADTGSDLEINIVNAAVNGTTPVDITTVGFEPEFVLATTIANTNLTTSAVHARLAVGLAHNDFGTDILEQASWLTDATNNVSPTVATRWLESDSISGRHQLGTNLGKVRVSDFDADGFTQVGSNAAVGLPHIFYFCVNTNGKIPIKVDTYAGPVSAAVDFEINSPSFEPQVVLGIHTAVLGLDSPLKEAGEQSGCFYTFDTDGAQACLGFTEEDNVTTSNAAQWASTANALHVVADNQASDLLLAGTPNLTPAGFTFPSAEITTADASARYGLFVAFGLVIEPTATGGEVITVSDSLTLTENQTTIGLDLDIQTVVDALTLSEGQATIGLDLDVQAVTDALTITENQATVGLDLDVPAISDTLTLTENQAVVAFALNIQTIVDALVLAENQAFIDTGFNVQAITDALTLSENQADLTLSTNIQTISDALTFAENQASIDLTLDVQSITDALILTENQATLTLSANILTVMDSLILAESQASIDLGSVANIQAITDTLTLTEGQASIGLDLNLLAVRDTLILTENQATVGSAVEILTTINPLILTENQATIGLDYNIQTTTDILALTENKADISFSLDLQTVTDALILTESQATIFLGEPSVTANIIVGSQMIAKTTDTDFPIQLAVNESGGVSGLTVDISLRDTETPTLFLDFNDLTMKSAGWVSKTKTLADQGNGYYGTTVAISSIIGMTGKHLSVEYAISGAVIGISNSVITIEDFGLNTAQDTKLTNINGELLTIEDVHGHADIMRGIWAMLAGQISGAETGMAGTATIRNMANTKTRMTIDFDAEGNRTNVTFLDLT